jgi:hypothetical protein
MTLLILARRAALALAAAGFLASPALAMDEVSRIDVEADFGRALDEGSVPYMETIAADLTRAIGQRVHMVDAGEGLILRVAVRELLADAVPLWPITNEFDGISGVVAISAPGDSEVMRSYPVMVGAFGKDVVAPDGYTVISPTDEQMYAGLIWGFADLVAKELARINPALVPQEYH